MRPGALLALGSVVVLGSGAAIGWWLIHDRPEPREPRTQAQAPSVDRTTTPGAPSLPEKPAAPAPMPAPTPTPTPTPTPLAPTATGPAGPSSAGSAFDEEPRDAAWADDQERAMALRLREIEDGLDEHGVKVRIGAPTCRRTRCRVEVGAADTGTLGKLFDALEAEDGLRGWADSMLLERVEAGDDGRVETAVVVSFDRGP